MHVWVKPNLSLTQNVYWDFLLCATQNNNRCSVFPEPSFICLSKVPVNDPLRVTQQGPLWRELTVYRAFVYMSLKFLIKIPLIKEIFLFLKGPRKGSSLHVRQKRGPYGNRHQFPQPYLACPSGPPVKSLSSRFPSQSSHRDRHSISTALLHSTFKVPGIRAPFQVYQLSPCEERCPSPGPSFTYSSGSPVM